MQLEPLHYILIALGALALIFFILWLTALSSKKKAITRTNEQFSKETSQLKSQHDASLEKTRIESKKTIAQQQEEYKTKIEEKEAHIDSLKLFSKDKGEYLTDLTMIQLKERLVRDERIRPEDMVVLANMYLPGKKVKQTDKLDHVILTRTGIYLIDSNYWHGHIFHGVSHMQFADEPMFESVFNIMGLDPNEEQTIVLKENENGNAEFENYKKSLINLKEKANRLQQVFNLPYPVTPIAYYNGDGYGAENITNYSNDTSVKVLVGEYELEHFFEKFVFHGRFQYKVEELEAIRAELEHLNP